MGERNGLRLYVTCFIARPPGFLFAELSLSFIKDFLNVPPGLVQGCDDAWRNSGEGSQEGEEVTSDWVTIANTTQGLAAHRNQ